MTMNIALVEWTEGAEQGLRGILRIDCVRNFDEDSYLDGNSGQVDNAFIALVLVYGLCSLSLSFVQVKEICDVVSFVFCRPQGPNWELPLTAD